MGVRCSCTLLQAYNTNHWAKTEASLCLCKETGRFITAGCNTTLTSAASNDISLAEVRFFQLLTETIECRRTERHARRPCTQHIFAVEVVSLRNPLCLGYFDDENRCAHAVHRLNACLSERRESETGPTSPVSLISAASPHDPASITITPHTKLLPEPLPETRFQFVVRQSNRLVCIRRSAFPRNPVSFLLFVNFAWFFSLFLSLICGKNISFHGMVANAWVIIGTILWPISLTIVILFWWKGDRWIFSNSLVKRRRDFQLMGQRFEISEFDRIALFAVTTSHYCSIKFMQRTWAHLVGGERFGVQLIPRNGEVYFVVERLLAEEALYIAWELRRMYPQLCALQP